MRDPNASAAERLREHARTIGTLSRVRAYYRQLAQERQLHSYLPCEIPVLLSLAACWPETQTAASARP